MEPNTTSSHTTWTSPTMVLEHGEPSMHDLSLLSPTISPMPSLSLFPMSRLGSASSWYQQVAPSPAMEVGNGSLRVHAHAASSQSMPLSIPIASTLPMVPYDLCGNPEMTTAIPVSTLLESQWEDGESSSKAASVLPDYLSSGLFGFACESTSWPSNKMLTSLLSLPSSSGLALAVEESPIDGPLSPNKKAGNIDMASSYGEASASWMAPTTMNMCTMVSTNSGSMAYHSVGSSIGITSSIKGMMEPISPMLHLVPPSSEGAHTSSNNFSGLVQPSSSSVLSPIVPNLLLGPLSSVKKQVMDSRSSREYINSAPRHHPPSFISLNVDDEKDRYNIFGSWCNNPTSFDPSAWLGSSSDTPSFVPSSYNYGSISSPSFAPSIWGGHNSDSTSFAPSSWSGGNSSNPSFAPSRWGSSSSSPSFVPGRWGSNNNNPSFAGSMSCFNQNTSIDIYSSSSTMKLSMGGNMSSTSDLPPLPRLGASNNKENGGTRIVFTNTEKAIITKDKKLQELLRKDPKKVKRILYNRAYSATAKVRNVMHTKNLERLVVTLEERHKSLCAELQSLQEASAALMAQHMEMQRIIGELEQKMMLKDVVRDGLRDEIQNLKHLKLIN